jgi:hypothetical protein
VKWVDFYVDAYGITQEGNFEGKTILQRRVDNSELASRYNLTAQEVELLLNELNQHLLEKRSERIRPASDDKVITSWNALALTVFSEAARYLDHPDYLDIACRNASFLWNKVYLDNRLYRSWRNGKARHNGYLEDYAGLILAYITLYQSNFETLWFSRARILFNELLAHFRDPDFGFFDTRDDHEKLLVRIKNTQDNATPSGNSLAALASIQLAAYESEGDWLSIVEESLSFVVGSMVTYPLGYSYWLCAYNNFIVSPKEVALIFPPGAEEISNYKRVLWSAYRPDCIVAAATYPPDENAPKILWDRPLINNRPTVYVCRNSVCDLPVDTPEQLGEKLL